MVNNEPNMRSQTRMLGIKDLIVFGVLLFDYEQEITVLRNVYE